MPNKHGCCTDKKCTPDTCMELPEGKTCFDCSNYKRCHMLCGHQATDTYCDWFPRRFVQKHWVHIHRRDRKKNDMGQMQAPVWAIEATYDYDGHNGEIEERTEIIEGIWFTAEEALTWIEANPHRKPDYAKSMQPFGYPARGTLAKIMEGLTDDESASH